MPTNTGDGWKMAMRAGAMLGNMREAWWMPIVHVPEEVCARASSSSPPNVRCRARSWSTRLASRFTNEAANYNAFAAAIHEQDTGSCSYRNLPCWVVFNQDF